MARNGLSAVIPVYNGRECLPELRRRLGEVLSAQGEPFEIIFVDDGSRDGGWSLLREFAAADARIKAIRLMRNHGQHNALLCGIRAASFPVTLTLDDDLQHPPEEIPKLLSALDGERDVVYGVFPEERHGWARTLASRITKKALRQAMGAPEVENVSALRVFRTGLRDAFASYQGPMPNIDVMLSWGTTRFTAVAVRHEPRLTGTSGYTLRKLVVHALNMITGYTVLPLQLASLMGFLITLGGLGLLAFILVRYMSEGSPIQGFPFLASIICLFSGAQLFALGILGEYFARMHLRLMDKPVYTAAERLNLDGQDSGS
jgi:glycosyltransferase involved in cell wall biosynthesis